MDARRLLAWLLAVLPGCTTVLGIDGDYVVREGKPDAGRRGGPRPAAAGGEGGTGGSVATGGGGGSGGGGTGGQPAAGGQPTGGCGSTCPPPDPCVPGQFTGKFKGVHSPSTKLPFLPTIPGVTPSVGGTVSLTFAVRTPGTLTVTAGRFDGSILGNAPFQADITGALDCASGRFDGKLVSTPVSAIAFIGAVSGAADVAGIASLSGAWNEAEQPPAPGAVGSGTWTATRNP